MMCNRQVHLVIAASFLGIFSSTMSMYPYNPKKMGIYYYNKNKNKKEKSEKNEQVDFNPLTIVKSELEAALEAKNACICTSHCKNLDPIFGSLRHNGIVRVVDEAGKFLYNIHGTNIEHLEELKQKAKNVHLAGRFEEIILLKTSSPIREDDRYDKRPSVFNKLN